MNEMNSLEVAVLDHRGLALCDLVHAESDMPLVYGSSAYMTFLLEALPRTQLHLLVAMDGLVPVGYLPLLSQSNSHGLVVMNSLPFFGSHGGPIVRRSYSNVSEVVNALLAKAMTFAREQNAASVTLIENPLAPLDAAELVRHGLEPVDDRIGQFTPLPIAAEIGDAYAALMSAFHIKTRNAVRKGQRLMQRFERRTDPAALAWFQETHAQTIVALGGVPKSMHIFRVLCSRLPWESGTRLYVGSVDGVPVSGLLLLQYGATVEYFTPVVIDAYRDQQALSALIFHAMAEAVVEGRALWSWGGTWRSQDGVYRFKRRFGAFDRPYRYFYRLFEPALQGLSGAEARYEFPYFYTHRYIS